MVREFSPLASNWRADETAQQFLTENGVPVIAGIDTRALVRHLRSRGVMRGVLSAACARTDHENWSNAPGNSPSMAGLDLATRVSTAATLRMGPGRRRRARRRIAQAKPRRAVLTWSPTISASSANSAAAGAGRAAA